RLLDRFCRYVRIETSADPASSSYPSSDGQWELGRLLRDELVAMGLTDAYQDEFGLVYATIPATADGDTATIALVAHMDTSPEAPANNIQPNVINNYDGSDIQLPHGIIAVDQVPELEEMVGDTLITTDGTTLLGGDDKAGVAIIMELAETLVEQPRLRHGPVKIVLTCDEEIGHGTDKINIASLGATAAYTIDGGGHAIIDHETFSADGVTVIFTGYNIHPAIAKDRMSNSIRAAADFVAALPKDDRTPETTQDREGFIHVHDVEGGVGETRVELILRSFESDDLKHYAELVTRLANEAAEKTPGVAADVQVRRQYRNLRDGLAHCPEAVELAEEAFGTLGIDCQRAIIRGGTDGSQLTEKGLPTPNLSSGQHNIHSVLEFANLDEMLIAGEHLVLLLEAWSHKLA
ncbi:MAG: peptidase T, partial [Planctomycetota bacterium]